MANARFDGARAFRRALGLLVASLSLACAFTRSGETLSQPALANPFRDAMSVAHVESNAHRTAATWRASRPADAAAMEKLAGQPTAIWLGDWYPAIETAVTQILVGAQSHGAPVLVLYNLPVRDCGQYARGGATTASGYRGWIDAIARSVGSQRAIFVIEPDGLAQMSDCLDASDREQRIGLIRHAIERLSALPATTVYVDAGHSAWLPAAEIAIRLRKAGIERADGFSLNVSNYRATDEVMAFGREVAKLVGGKHFIVDTSRNGNGPPEGLAPGDEGNWCNPDGRALGAPPTIQTGDPLCDAFYWIKAPGESDGSCNHGPSAGAWWPQQALEMARNAKW